MTRRTGKVAALLAAALTVGACTAPIPNRNPSGERFPSIEATALDSADTVRIPEDFEGAPLVVLVGYVQDAQFDLDRWLYGLLDSGLEVPLREVPAARGMAARLASGFIDSGMRSGIPPDEWGAVVTTYGNTAEAIARFTGTEAPRNARVLLLDAGGVVRWFHGAGYSARRMIDLERAAAELTEVPAEGLTPPGPSRTPGSGE